jgi:mannose-6-phosphate isomerase-like protein (cupin superfamily)
VGWVDNRLITRGSIANQIANRSSRRQAALSEESFGSVWMGLRPTNVWIRNKLASMRLTLLLTCAGLSYAQTANAPAHTPIENDYVRVVWATDQPVDKPGSLHEHKQNRVMIYLDAGTMRIAYADGRVDNQHWKAGDVAWSPANGMHTSQNVGKTPLRIVEIEVRKGAAPETKAGAYKTIDNAQVHVYRSSKPPAPGKEFVAVNAKTGDAAWDKLPGGPGPFVIAEMK